MIESYVKTYIIPVSQTRPKPSRRLKCMFEYNKMYLKIFHCYNEYVANTYVAKAIKILSSISNRYESNIE